MPCRSCRSCPSVPVRSRGRLPSSPNTFYLQTNNFFSVWNSSVKQTKDARRQTGPDGTDETGTDETETTTAREGRSRTPTPHGLNHRPPEPPRAPSLGAMPVIADPPGAPRHPGGRRPPPRTHRLGFTLCQACIQPLDRNPTTKQKSNHYTEIQPLYRNPATIQASSHYTCIQPFKGLIGCY